MSQETDLHRENRWLKEQVAALQAELVTITAQEAALAAADAALAEAAADAVGDPDLSWLHGIEGLCALGYEHRQEPFAGFLADFHRRAPLVRPEHPGATAQDACAELGLRTHNDVAVFVREVALAALLAGANHQRGMAHAHDAHSVLADIAVLVEAPDLFRPT